ncbi:MAG: nucleoside hydrolase [Alistipes sp.]|nr:nucleoside hydrolase [Alistipes sp.]
MKKLLLLVLLLGLGYTSTFAQAQKKPQSIIFETDMGNDIDDALALDILFKNMDQGNIKLLGVGVHKNNPYSAEYIDIMRHWYGYKKTPIGVNTACVTDMDCVDYCTKTCLMKDEDGNPLFKRSKNPKYEEAVEMYRRILSKQPDKSVVIVTVGFSTTIAQLLQSQPDKYSKLSGMELVKQKVSWFSVMAGDMDRPTYAEYNVWNDLEAAKYFFDNSPCPIVLTPFTIGLQIEYPASSIEKDFNWEEPNPMAVAYKHYDKMPYDRPTWDVTAAYYACHPDHKCFTLNGPVDVKVVGKGQTPKTPNPNGNFRYLTATPEQQKQILDYFIRTLSTKPLRMK